MHPRLDFQKAAPDALRAVLQLETYVQNSGLERRFIHLIKLRASQINGCAYCVDMHVKESRHDGLSEQWINLMSVWRESGVYDAHFTAAEIMNITVAIGTIKTWNRLAVGFRTPHPLDQPAAAA